MCFEVPASCYIPHDSAHSVQFPQPLIRVTSSVCAGEVTHQSVLAPQPTGVFQQVDSS